MRSAHSNERASCLSLGPDQAAELLLELESVAFEGRVRIDSEFGTGEILVCGGNMTSAHFGPESGRAALMRLLSLPNGTWTVEDCRIAEGAPLVAGVDALVLGDEARQKYWDGLCASAPPAGSILHLTLAGERVRDTGSGSCRALLGEIDGQRALLQILEESELDPLDAMRGVLNAIDAGLVVASTSKNSLFPLAATADSSGLVACDSRVNHQLTERDQNGEFSQHCARKPALSGGIVASGSASGTAPGQDAVRVGVDRYRGETLEHNATEAEPSHVRVRHFIGRYEIIMRIGRGGMGTVYLSRMNSEEAGFRRLVALKLLRSHLCRDAQAARDFLDEARLAGAIHHANVVGVSDAGIHGQQPFLVMDYIEGTSLRQLMADAKSREPRFLVPILIDALAGLHAVHTLCDDVGQSLGLVHCDVSPENILVGIDGISRLADFGIVRRASGIKGAKLRGKLGYVAPEQIAGQSFDHRADIYAMGVVLWNSLTGKDIGTLTAVGAGDSNFVELDVPPPSTLGAASSAALDRVIMRALARTTQERFETAEHMLSELHAAALAGDGLATAPEITAWVRQVAGHELANRRLAVIDTSHLIAVDSREFPAPNWLLSEEQETDAREPPVSHRTAPWHAPTNLAGRPSSSQCIGRAGTTLTVVSRSQGGLVRQGPDTRSRPPSDPAIGGLFYGAESMFGTTTTDKDSSEEESDIEAEIARLDSANNSGAVWLKRRIVVISVTILLGVAAGYLAMCATLPWLLHQLN